MNAYVWYHGANGDNTLKIIQQKQLKPNNGQIFLSSAGYAGCFPMGADIKRRACFVLKLRCHIPPEVTITDKATNVPGTKVLGTKNPVRVDVLEMYVRPGSSGPITVIKDTSSMVKYLTTPSK